MIDTRILVLGSLGRKRLTTTELSRLTGRSCTKAVYRLSLEGLIRSMPEHYVGTKGAEVTRFRHQLTAEGWEREYEIAKVIELLEGIE